MTECRFFFIVTGVDLTSPLRSLTPSLESAVLEVLAGTESGLNAVQIARLARRGTRTGQRPVLERLVEHGLVIADPANTGFLYRLNRDHVLTPAVLSAVGARVEVLERLTRACEQLEPVPVHASVFGSFARREAGPESDIDLMLVVSDDVDTHETAWADQMRDLEDRVLAWTGNRLQSLIFTRARLAQVVHAGEPIASTWSADAVTLIGVEPAGLVARANKKVRR